MLHEFVKWGAVTENEGGAYHMQVTVSESRRSRLCEEEAALNDIIGIVMLLAMVVIVLSIVVTIIQPYVKDFDDNKSWSQSRVMADQIDERVRIVGASPNATGSVLSFDLGSTSFRELDSAEVWTISADVYALDVVEVALSSFNSVSVTALNGTAKTARVDNGGNVTTHTLTFVNGSAEVDFVNSIARFLSVELLDEDANVIHKYFRIELSGIRLHTAMTTGVYYIDLVNGAWMERLLGQPYTIDRYPSLRHQERTDGAHQVSLVLVDTDLLISGGSDASMKLEMVSNGPLSLFDGAVRNLHMIINNDIDVSMEERYLQRWTEDYNLNMAAGTLENFIGFGPWKRASGIDGLGVYPSDTTVMAEIVLHGVVVT